MAPAPSSAGVVCGSDTPATLTATSDSTKKANTTAIPAVESQATASAPSAIPGTRPRISHCTPRGSAEALSRTVIIAASSPPAHSIGPGIRSGSISTSRGAATKPMPKPSEPCSAAPSASAAPASTVSNKLMRSIPYGVFRSSLKAEAVVYRAALLGWHTWPVRICVVGAGAIGGMLAVRLSVAGHEVCVVARGENLLAIQRNGLQLVEIDGSRTVAADVPASDDFGTLGTHDAVILALKAHQIAPIAARLRLLCDGDTMIVPVQNGIGWWYFQRHGGPYEGHRLEAVDPGGVIASAVAPERIVACIAYPAAEKDRCGGHHPHRG